MRVTYWVVGGGGDPGNYIYFNNASVIAPKISSRDICCAEKLNHMKVRIRVCYRVRNGVRETEKTKHGNC